MAQDSLFFLRSELPDDPLSKGFRWSLQLVKVRDAVQGAYVAFCTHDLAERFANGVANIEVVAATDLDGNHFTDFSNKRVVLFKSHVEVKNCLANRADYPYEQHLFTYVP